MNIWNNPYPMFEAWSRRKKTRKQIEEDVGKQLRSKGKKIQISMTQKKIDEPKVILRKHKP